MSEKNHAKDFLNEFLSQKAVPDWEKKLILICINKNGTLTAGENADIFSALLKENDILSENTRIENGTENESLASNKESFNSLILNKIEHVRGVNALIEGESILFSPNCNILYGKNGSGKSGYFKILNELAGGLSQRKILNNIRKSDESFEVNIEYSTDENAPRTFNWLDKTQRGISPFNKIRVFDSSYLPFYLDERENTINIEPLGLNYFRIIVQIIDHYKSELNSIAEEKRNQAPDLKSLLDNLHDTSLKSLLHESSVTKENHEKIRKLSKFITDDERQLNESLRTKSNIERYNLNDRIKIIEKDSDDIDTLLETVSMIEDKIKDYTVIIPKLIAEHKEKTLLRDKRKSEFDLLKNLPSQDSPEWFQFIDAGERYRAMITQEIVDENKTCIYCHQELKSSNALRLIQSYSEFISDESQQKLKIIEDTISQLILEFDKTNLTITLTPYLRELTGKIKHHSTSIKDIINDYAIKVHELKVLLIKNLTTKVDTIIDNVPIALIIKIALGNLSTIKKTKIDKLRQTINNKAETISELNKAINPLEDRKLLNLWQDRIDKFFKLHFEATKLNTVANSLNSKSISILSANAHEELITESLQERFQKELDFLEVKTEVQINKVRAGKGKMITRLQILHKNVQDILSEGEQKATGLALFIAELANQTILSPIIFDYPVNSLDNRFISLFAERIIDMSLQYQTIIFTHNIYFRESLFHHIQQNNKDLHICKNLIPNGCSTSGKHSFYYRIERESKDRTGKVLKSDQESCSYYLKKVTDALKGDYLPSSISADLKSAIEYYIDEKILNKQILTKFKPVKGHIEWENLQKVNPDGTVIKILKKHWDTLSMRGTHTSMNQTENPIEIEEFDEIINFLKN